MAYKSHVTLNSLNRWTPICSMFSLKEAPYPGHMVIRFWCDTDHKDITFFTLFILKIGDSTVFLYNWCILAAKAMWGGWKSKLCQI